MDGLVKVVTPSGAEVLARGEAAAKMEEAGFGFRAGAQERRKDAPRRRAKGKE